jgi:hypothetical protein
MLAQHPALFFFAEALPHCYDWSTGRSGGVPIPNDDFKRHFFGGMIAW